LKTKKPDELAFEIRRLVLRHTIDSSGGYLSQACSSAEIFGALFGSLLRLNPVEKPLIPRPFPGVPSSTNTEYFRGTEFYGEQSADTDRFILSPTHYSLVLYAALAASSRMDENGLLEFNKDGSSVEMIGAEHSPGMEVMTGSLGQGLSQAAGIAFGRRIKKETGRVIVFMSDGEFQTGMTWETLQFMSHHKLDNLIIITDNNRQQCDGCTESVMSVEPLAGRAAAFGAETVTVDGHDTAAIESAFNTGHKGKPLLLICNTDPCRGVEPLKQNAPKLHYLRFKSKEEKNKYINFYETNFKGGK